MERKASFREKLKKCVKLTPFQVRCHFSCAFETLATWVGVALWKSGHPAANFLPKIQPQKTVEFVLKGGYQT